MGRPEKSGVREMKPLVHSLYPIAESGGPQRLLERRPPKEVSEFRWGREFVDKCGSESPHIRCHVRPDPNVAKECGGRTEVRKSRGGKEEASRRVYDSPGFIYS